MKDQLSGDRWADPAAPAVPSPTGARGIFALLLITPDRPVPAATLFEEVWGMAAPTAPRTTVKDHIARLKKTVGYTIAAEGDNPFYGDLHASDNVPSVAVDMELRRRRQLHEAGRRALARGDHALAVEHLGDALAIDWSTAADGQQGWADERAGIETLYADARLRLGMHEWAVDGIDRRAAADPAAGGLPRESVDALRRAGRHAEALAVLRRADGAAGAGYGRDRHDDGAAQGSERDRDDDLLVWADVP